MPSFSYMYMYLSMQWQQSTQFPHCIYTLHQVRWAIRQLVAVIEINASPWQGIVCLYVHMSEACFFKCRFCNATNLNTYVPLWNTRERIVLLLTMGSHTLLFNFFLVCMYYVSLSCSWYSILINKQLSYGAWSWESVNLIPADAGTPPLSVIYTICTV